MKRILLLNYEFPPLGGGAGNTMFYLLKEFAKQEDIVIDAVVSSTGKYREEVFSPNIRVYFLDIGKNQRNLHHQTTKDILVYSWKAFRFAKKLIAKNNYDLTHAFFGIPCGYIASKLGLPFIVSLLGSDVPFHNRRFRFVDALLFQRLSRTVWKNAQIVIANSQGLKESALKSNPDQSIEVIPNGVDTNIFRKNPQRKSGDDFSILFVGRLSEHKGVRYLLEAFAKLHQEQKNKSQTLPRLLLAGDGPLRSQLEMQIKSMDLSDAVHFSGIVAHEDLPDIYRQSDVFVLPSDNEGMSNTLLEAIASGLPVITTDTGGSAELVDGNGIVVSKRNSEAIYDALKKLISNPDLREKYSLKSTEIAKNMDWKKVAERYLRFYCQEKKC